MSRKKISAVEREYNKVRSNLVRYVAKYEKKGFKFDENLIPNKPKRITKASVDRLKKITPQKRFEKSIFFTNGQRNEEYIKGSSAIYQIRAGKLEYTKSAKESPFIPTRVEVITERFEEVYISTYLGVLSELNKGEQRTGTPLEFKGDPVEKNTTYINKLLNMLNNLDDTQIEMVGKALAEEKDEHRIEYALEDITKGTYERTIRAAFDTLATYLVGRPLTIYERIAISEAQGNDWGDIY